MPAVVSGAEAQALIAQAAQARGGDPGELGRNIEAKAGLLDSAGMISHQSPADGPDQNTGGIPTMSADGKVLAPPPVATPPRPPAQQQQAPAAPTMPAKFANITDPAEREAAILRSYQELERRLGAGNQQPQGEQQEPQTQQQAPPAAPPQGEQQEAPVQLTPEQETQMAGVIVTAVGGQQAFEALAAWAPEHGDPATVELFNTAAASGQAEVAELAAKALRYDMIQRQGMQPTLVGGMALSSTSGLQPYRSDVEANQAMNDPRYLPGPRQDPDYVREVEKRIALSMR